MTLISDPPRTAVKPLPDVEVLFPEARRRRRRRRLGWLAAALCIALLIAFVAVARGQTSNRSTPSRTRPFTRIVQVQTPKEIVAWTSDRELEVISTTTGAVERTLASDVALFAPGVPTLSVSPVGVVFFDSVPTVGISPPDAQGDQIYSVSIVGGPVREVSPGYDPAISPDGRTLAFVASNGVGEAPYQLASGGIELAQLNGSEITGVRTLHPSGTMVGAGFSNLSWSADSQILSFDQLDPSSDVTSSWLLSGPNAKSSLASAVEIPLHPKGLAWGGFLDSSTKGEPLGIGVQTAVQDEPPLASSQKVVSIDPQTGAIVRALFELPAAVCTSASPSTPEDCDSDFSNALDVDPASSSVLVSGAIPLTDGQVSTSGLTYLFRWATDSAKPVRLTSGVLVAAWGPGPATSSSGSH
jgi:WD40-like Beta Propeller Repeat